MSTQRPTHVRAERHAAPAEAPASTPLSRAAPAGFTLARAAPAGFSSTRHSPARLVAARSSPPATAAVTTRWWALVLVLALLPAAVTSLVPLPASAAAVPPAPVAAGPSACPAQAAASRPRARWPLDADSGSPPVVLAGFDPPARPWLTGHRGVDLAAQAGDTVHAALAGTVVFAGEVAGTPAVSVDHGNGIRTTYVPVSASVSQGAQVCAGDVIGTLVAGHRTDTDALHWGARRSRDVYVNPLWLVRPPPLRLKAPG